MPFSRIFEISFDSETSILFIINELSKLKEVEYAELRYIQNMDAIPNDTFYDSLFFLPQIKANLAWDIHKGENNSNPILIGINDSGVEWFHSDLVQNLFQNLGEDADGDGSVIEFVGGVWRFDTGDENGIDDDNNGKIDDFVGWNFKTDDDFSAANNPYALADNDHGTHVAGIAAGRTNNNNGIASVSWNVKFLPTKHGSNNGGSSVYNTYDGLVYLTDMGVDVINCSWGSYDSGLMEKEIIDYCIGEGVVIFASAGNGNSEHWHYPSGYDGVISVASVNQNDGRAYYSDFGIDVDISTPGGDSRNDAMIKSTVPNNTYANLQGTSMATPLAVGAFALLKSYNNTWTNEQLIKQLLSTSDNISNENPGFDGQLGYGRVNVFKALDENETDISKKLKLLLNSYSFDDENGNGLLEPNETVQISASIINKNQFYGSNNLSYSFTTASNQLTLNNSAGMISIGANGDTTEIVNVSFKIANVAQVNDFVINLTFTNPDGIEIGNTFNLTYSTPNHLYGWGRNNYGQLGNGTTTNSFAPIKIGNDKWVSISAGWRHSLGVKSDGTLWAWGNNDYAQLGDNTVTSRNIPTKIGTSSNWKNVSAGYYYSIAIQKDGTLWSWGNNYYGQLGHNNTSTYYVPTKVGTDNDWAEITSGFAHNIALKTNGTLWAWGYNEYGQIGDTTNTNRLSPRKIGSSTDWFSVFRANNISFALIKGSDIVEQTIHLKQGWNLISINIQPSEPDSINNVLNGIKNNLLIAKNNAGAVYIPSFDINNIGKWNITQGYQIYMNNADTLDISGTVIDPSITQIELSAGWNMISYLRNAEMSAIDAFSSITDNNNLLIAKTLEGSVYIPSYGINTIGNLKPGVGYKIYVGTSDTLIYPNN